jgi:hypothetical protein
VFSVGSQAFVCSSERPDMPARPRRCVVATLVMPFCSVQIPLSSCDANVIGLPRRDWADDVTTSMRPSFGSRMNCSPTRITSDNGPFRIIA